MQNKLISFSALIISDFIVVFLSFLLAYFIRSDILSHLFISFRSIPVLPFANFLEHYYVGLVWIAIFAYEKLYTKRYTFWAELKVLIKSATLSSILIMILIFVTKTQLRFSRTIVVLAWLLSLFLFPLFRYITKILLVKANIWKKKLIILGVHQTSLLILKSIIENKTMGYEILGFLDDDPLKQGKTFSGVKVLGRTSALRDIAAAYRSKDIMIATPHLSRKQLKSLLSECEQISESMWVIPRSGDFVTEGVEIEVIGDVLTLYIKKNLEKPWNIVIKNTFDAVLTLIMIPVFLPIFVVIAAAIKLDSKGPVLFVQKRFGRGRKAFNLYKFRSMYVNCDDKLDEYLKSNSEARAQWETYRKLKTHDPRITRVGRIIRRYSLDELPQLFNVILGQMSLVGPRPYLEHELEGNEGFRNILARTKPGITGLWQVSGRSELPFRKRVSLDEYYIRNWSLWLDFVILLKTFKVFLSRKGAY